MQPFSQDKIIYNNLFSEKILELESRVVNQVLSMSFAYSFSSIFASQFLGKLSNALRSRQAGRNLTARREFSIFNVLQPFLFFANLRKDFSNLNYLVHICYQISFR